MDLNMNNLLGDEEEFTLEHRIYNIILLLGTILCFLCGSYKYFIDIKINALVSLFSGFILLFLYWWSIKKQQYLTPLFSSVLIFTIIIIPLTWLFGAGTSGITPYYLIVFSSTVAISLSGLRRNFVLSLLILTVMALIAFEYKYPYLITGYNTSLNRFVDISVGLIMAIIFNFFLFVLVFKNYTKEHKRMSELLLQIEKQNLDIEFQKSLTIINEKLKQEISERKQAENLLRESEKRFRNLVENINDVIFTLNTREIVTYISNVAEKGFSYRPDEVIGKSFRSFIHPDDLLGVLESYKSSLAGDLHPVDFRVFDKNGCIRHVRVSNRPLIENGQVIGITGVLVDITERKQMEDELRKHRDNLEEIVKERTAELKLANEHLQREIIERKQIEAQLKHLATHDHLTSVPNRYSFEESLKRIVAKGKRGQESSLLFIDIDNFKLVNDTKGHTAGDRLLITVAKTIKENIRESDTLARLGGDEFGVLLEGATTDDAMQVAEKLRKIIEDKEFNYRKYGSISLSFSIGVAMIDGTMDSQRLLSLADTALYAAKGKGGNRVVLLDNNEETTTKSAIINQVVVQVRNALKEDKFVQHFQPVVKVDNGQVIYHEALLRLEEEEGKLISPIAFIPVAEKFGLMPQIDRWVVRKTLDILNQHPELRLFVNISGLSMNDEFLLEDIAAMIAQCNMESSRIGFEITETVAVQDMLLVRRWIDRLKKLGCRFALDDFGIGFSSFSYLRMLPVDYVKIDGSFIRNLDKDPSHRAFVEAMNTVAHSLGKKTIAEYVENEHVLKILQELKIDYAQGYFLGVPSSLKRETFRV